MESKTNFRVLGPETEKGHSRRLTEGFYERFLSGERVLDIGFRGGSPDAMPVTENAIGIELDYPGYDGINLPFDDESQDAVFASHTLEHIRDWRSILADWFRVLKIGGFLIIAVPHRYLYERKADLPSRFNGDHKRFYTAGSLLVELETALPKASWRLRSLREIDDGFDYTIPPESHAVGSYEIELVAQRISTPEYVDRLVPCKHAEEFLRFVGRIVAEAVEAGKTDNDRELAQLQGILCSLPLPPIGLLERHIPINITRSDLVDVLRPWISNAPFDEADYLKKYVSVSKAVEDGIIPTGLEHYVQHGYFEGAIPMPPVDLFR